MMEHGRFAYSAFTKRRPLPMPGGARLAVWVTPNIEHFHYDKPAISLTPMTAGLRPDVLNYAWRDYGARVGIWRLIEILDRHRIPVTAALNAECCERYPAIVEAGNTRGWEWMAHGLSNSVLHAGLAEDDERKMISSVIETITAGTGKQPRGWLSPALTETSNTPDLLAEAGIAYVADWCNDELPYRMRTRAGALVAMPYTLEIGDIPIFLEQGGSAEDFYRVLVDQFDVLWEEGAKHPRVMSIALHPFLIGHPFRAKHLDRALAHMRARGGVWFATGSDILNWYLQTAPSEP